MRWSPSFLELTQPFPWSLCRITGLRCLVYSWENCGVCRSTGLCPGSPRKLS